MANYIISGAEALASVTVRPDTLSVTTQRERQPCVILSRPQWSRGYHACYRTQFSRVQTRP